MGGDTSDHAQEPPDDEHYQFSPLRRGMSGLGRSVEIRGYEQWTERSARGVLPSPSPPDISVDIFSGNARKYRQLFEEMPVYFSYSVLTLLRQSQEAFEAFRLDFDYEQVLMDPHCFGRLAAYFSGYVRSDAGVILEERLPILDIEIAATFKVGFKNVYRAGKTSTFKVKVMGVGGSGARIVSQSLTTSFGPYVRSCQLQAPVNVEWRSYTRSSTGETLLTLKFLPTGTVGLYFAAEDDPTYKQITAARDTKLAIVNRSGEKPTEMSWRIERGFRSNFEVPLSFPVGSSISTHSILVDSEVMNELVLDMTHEGQGGHLYGCARDAVVLRLDE